MEGDVRHNPARQRYEIDSDGGLAGFTMYTTRPGVIVFTHTEVDDRFADQGLGSRLARGALDAVRAKGLHAEAQCPFIARYIHTHQQYADLLPPRHGS